MTRKNQCNSCHLLNLFCNCIAHHSDSQLFALLSRFRSHCILFVRCATPFCNAAHSTTWHCFTAFPLNKYATSTSPHCSSHPTSRSTQYSIRLCFIISLHTHCTNLSLLHHRIVLHLLHDILHVALFQCIPIVQIST